MSPDMLFFKIWVFDKDLVLDLTMKKWQYTLCHIKQAAYEVVFSFDVTPR